jgi:hypothetical protein
MSDRKSAQAVAWDLPGCHVLEIWAVHDMVPKHIRIDGITRESYLPVAPHIEVQDQVVSARAGLGV